MVTYNYPPYGAVETWDGSGTDTPLQYAGTYSDGFTGLVYDQARWYDPSTGQFLSQDPLVDQTLQPYAYAADNPLAYGDPAGLKKKGKRDGKRPPEPRTPEGVPQNTRGWVGDHAWREAYEYFKRHGWLRKKKGKPIEYDEFERGIHELKRRSGRIGRDPIKIWGDRHGTVTAPKPTYDPREAAWDWDHIGDLVGAGVLAAAAAWVWWQSSGSGDQGGDPGGIGGGPRCGWGWGPCADTAGAGPSP